MTTTLGQRIRVARLEAGLSQRALAEKAGCSQPYLSDIELTLDHWRPIVDRLAEALAVHPAKIVYGVIDAVELADDEEALLDAYRNLHPNHRPELLGLAQRWSAP